MSSALNDLRLIRRVPPFGPSPYISSIDDDEREAFSCLLLAMPRTIWWLELACNPISIDDCYFRELRSEMCPRLHKVSTM
jgi:hypothetical protein